ncbi:MAG: GNAT family N-acetyltransferase [Candidatus Sumerlaeota bacterium]|nr:GNAT family N-acetyltransferase [Candidatus Sumerlaeota bacterium]
MQIDLSKAALSEKSLLQRMMQLYQYDFSEFEGNDLDDHALFNYKYLDHYWVEEGRTPLIVSVDGRLAGFVLVNKHSYTAQERFCIAEFFIMRKYRRKGIGKEVAHRVFDMFGPLWEVQQTKKNTAAQDFWRSVVNEYTNGDFDFYENGLGDWDGPILAFKRQTKT